MKPHGSRFAQATSTDERHYSINHEKVNRPPLQNITGVGEISALSSGVRYTRPGIAHQPLRERKSTDYFEAATQQEAQEPRAVKDHRAVTSVLLRWQRALINQRG